MARGRRRNNPPTPLFVLDDDDDDDEQPHVCYPHLRNEYWALIQGAERTIECPICLETLTSKYQLTLLICGHALCGDCWFRMKQKKCPVCRS